jgi:hypothetical protein
MLLIAYESTQGALLNIEEVYILLHTRYNRNPYAKF